MSVFLFDGHLFLQQQAQYFGPVSNVPEHVFDVERNTPSHIVHRIKNCWETVSKRYFDGEGLVRGNDIVIFIVRFVTQTLIQCFNYFC